MLFVGTSIIHPSTEGVFLLCNILDLLIYSLNIKEKRWQEEMYNENEEIEKELTLSQYIDELDIPEEVLEDNVFGL